MKILSNLTKRPVLAIVSIVATTCLFCFSTFALSIVKSDLSIYEKSDGVIVDNPESLEENGAITPDITFSRLGDFITYKLTLSDNDNSAYQITDITDNNTNENITTSYSYSNATDDSDKDVYITLTYANELTEELNLTDFEVTVNYKEITPANDDGNNDDNNNDDNNDNNNNDDDDEEISVPYTGSPVNDGPSANGTNGTSTPDTGSQTFSKTFSIETPSQNNNTIKIILTITTICILASALYLLFRKSHQNKNFGLTNLSRPRQILCTLAGLAIGFVIIGGAIGITHATNSNSLILPFNLSKIKITVAPTAARTVQFTTNSPNVNISSDNTTKTCDLYFNNTTCEIALPSFTATSGYEVLGWSTNTNAHEALYQPGETVAFSADTTLYAITRKNLLASFINQHDAYFTISKDSDSCYVYNNEISCQITTPNANKISATSSSEFLGWHTNSEALAPEASADTTFSISENTALYSVASIPATTISINFVNNDPTGVTSISETTKSCTMVDEESSCSIIIPDFTVASGYTKIGWNSNSNAEIAEYLPGQEVSFQSSATFYTISKTTFTASFINQNTNYFTISANSASCDAYNGATSCPVTTPTTTATTLGQAKEATFLGWNILPNSTNAEYLETATIAISENTTFYTVSYETLTATFTNLHTDYFSTSTTSASCYLYNGSTDGCTVSTPAITKLTNDPDTTFLGWNTDAATQSGMESGSSFTIYSNNTYYSIAKIPTDTTYSLRFMNNAMSDSEIPSSYFSSANDCLNYSGDYCTMVEKSCTVYTWEASCAIKAPDFNTAPGWDAYGHDTKYSGNIFSETDLSNNFKSIGEDITVTAVSNGNGYNTIIKKHNPTTATFVNQHTKYHIVSSANNASCYIFNNNGACSVSTPSLIQEGNYNNITKLVWSTKPSAYSNEITPTETVDISENSTFYSAASGIAYSITFDKNTNFEGLDDDGIWGYPNNIAADSLSFYQTNCTVTNSGCYLSSAPRIYSTGNTPVGFSIPQDGDYWSSLIQPLSYNFVADTTVYARVFDWQKISKSFPTTKKIYLPNSNTEYYQIDFQDGLKEELIEYYGDYIEEIFSKAPQLFVLHGKMRFLTIDTFEANYGSDARMMTYMYGLYSPTDARTIYQNATDNSTKANATHELGHQLDSAWKELYGTEISSHSDFQDLFNKYKAMYDAYVEDHGSFTPNDGVPMRPYAYTNLLEFFAEAFAIWFGNKSGLGSPATRGYIEDDISKAIDGYLCNTTYDKIPYIDSSPVCNVPNN